MIIQYFTSIILNIISAQDTLHNHAIIILTSHNNNNFIIYLNSTYVPSIQINIWSGSLGLNLFGTAVKISPELT